MKRNQHKQSRHSGTSAVKEAMLIYRYNNVWVQLWQKSSLFKEYSKLLSDITLLGIRCVLDLSEWTGACFFRDMTSYVK
jgi:hypothetical protein